MTFNKFKLPKDGFAVLTLTEPWATLCLLPSSVPTIGEKEWETRGWSTSYRGLLLVQAAKTFPRYAQAACLSEPFESVLARHGYRFDIHPDSIGGKTAKLFGFPLGAITGAVDLIDTRATEALASDLKTLNTHRARQELAFGEYSIGRRAFRFANPRRFTTPLPVRGSLGIWGLDGELADRAREQLALCAAAASSPPESEYRIVSADSCDALKGGGVSMLGAGNGPSAERGEA